MVDVSTLPAYSFVVQNLYIRLLLLMVKANKLNIATVDVGNAYINAKVGEKVCSRAGSELSDKVGRTLETLQASHGLKTSARQWSLCLGNAFCSMEFDPSRADPDLWTRAHPRNNGCDCIATFVDDLIVVAKVPL